MIVIVLLALLSVVGFLFYTFAAQEEANARNFAAAMKGNQDGGLTADDYFNFGLDQLADGARNDQPQSALWSPRHAVVSSMLGKRRMSSNRNADGTLTDLHPYNGGGVNVILYTEDLNNNGVQDVGEMDTDGNGVFDINVPRIDQDFNGVPDSGLLLDYNDSPAAWAALANTQFADPNGVRSDFSSLPQPDVDYTYPDINNLFLAYDGFGLDGAGRPVRVIIPSFLRPQYLRTTRGTGQPILDWYDNSDPNTPSMARRLLRPHPDHVAFDAQGNPQPGVSRFLTNTQAQNLGLSSGGFPFAQDLNGNGAAGEMGVWTNSYTDTNGNGAWDPGEPWNYEFDVDNDGDGTNEGIWIDLGFPIQEDPDNPGKFFVPLFSFTIKDLDSLLNLNIHGNLPGQLDANNPLNLKGNPFGGLNNQGAVAFLSKSNSGVDPSEVNPLYALSRDPNTAVSPATTFDQHQKFFGHIPANRREAGNMEWWFLNAGRGDLQAAAPTTNIKDLFAGRWGDMNYLFAGLTGFDADGNGAGGSAGDFPRPGRWRFDDNFDSNEGGLQGVVPAFVQPLDFSHSGRLTNPLATNYGKQLLFVRSGPNHWLQYTNYGLAGIVKAFDETAGTVPWRPWRLGADNKPGVADVDDNLDGTIDDLGEIGAAGSDDFRLMVNTRFNALDDDPMEIVVEPKLADRPNDEPFEASETAYLQLSTSDLSNTGTTARLQDLLPFNFDKSSPDTEAIRERFTTLSFDRKQYGFPRLLNPGPDGKLGTPDDTGFRVWEFSADTDQDGRLEFPPQFGGPGGDGQFGTSDDPVPAFGTLDPFRPQLRRLLEMEQGNADQLRRQFRLGINGILDVVRRPNLPANERFERLTYRPLTPHPQDPNLGGNPIPDYDPRVTDPADPRFISYPPTNLQEQEFWARYDRQRIARDIYVLLYTLGGGDDSVDYSLLPATTVYPDPDTTTPVNETLQRMAQFAVNVVDALDRDNVITKFEYDLDLSDGWGLDDDAYHPASGSVVDGPSSGDTQSGERAAVFGVEAQQLTLSEALAFSTQQAVSNLAATEYDDQQPHYFMYVELRNAGPFDSANPPNSPSGPHFTFGNWRIRMVPDPTSGVPERRLIIGPGAGGLGPGDPAVTSGGLFTVATTSDSSVPDTAGGALIGGQKHAQGDPYSFFKVDPTGTGGVARFQDPATWIAPRESGAPLQPRVNLDLIADLNAPGPKKFWITDDAGNDQTTTAGALLQPFVAAGGGSAFTLVLERRAHGWRPPPPSFVDTTPQNQDNPWVEVDRMQVADFPTFKLQSNDTAEIDTQLRQLTSHERAEPLNANVEDPHQPVAPLYKANSLVLNNSNSPAVFSLWQPHFDRDFASVMELLSIPLYGPAQVTSLLAGPATDPATINRMTGYTTAGEVFLFPQDPDNFALAQGKAIGRGKSRGRGKRLGQRNSPFAVDPKFDNRWYRLLELLEVPTRTHRQLGDPLNITRVPGKINLNEVRDPEVLAGLLDDEDVFHFARTEDLNGNGVQDPGEDVNGNGVWPDSLQQARLTDRSGETQRDWWLQFLEGRDGIIHPGSGAPIADPATGLYLPGVPGSRPLRSLAFLGRGNDSLEDTFLRRLIIDIRDDVLPLGTPADPNGLTNRRLFELGNQPEYVNGTVDYYSRRRLLSKVYDNTTTRSNVFAVWMTVASFEAVEDPPNSGVVRVGGLLGTDTNGDGKVEPFEATLFHRGFFVLDRSQIEEAYNRTTRKFDWQKLVKHRLTIK